MDILPSVISGFFGALAGASGKVGFRPDEESSYLSRAVWIVLMLGLNSIMVKYMVKSFQVLGASKATIINLGCNYLCSALVGVILFEEVIEMRWFLGASIIMLGIFLIARDDS